MGDAGSEEADEAAGEAAAADGTRRLEDMSIDEFLNQSDFEEEGEEGEEESDEGEEGEEEEESEESEEEEEGEEEDDGSEEDEEPSEDEGEDDEHLSALNKENAKMRSEVKSHKATLEKLKETDPEFYEFLQTEDQDLLEFDEDDDEEDEEDLSDDDDDDGERKKKKQRVLTTELVQKLCANAESGDSLAGAKSLFQAYRAACHYGDDENDGDEASVRLASSSAFHELVQFTLMNGDGILRSLLGVKNADEESSPSFKPHTNSRWKKVQPLAKSYIGNTLHLLGNLTDAEMTGMVLRQLKLSIPFMATFERLIKRVTRTALHCFGSGEPAVRVQAILLLRALAIGLPAPALERVAKGVYRTFASNSKFVNADSVEHVAFMSTCVVEIFGLDQQQSYPLAFAYIRQLASLLRGALTAKSKESFRNVYCWQYVNCLECWERVLSAHAGNESAPLRPLVYPLAQVALGAARLLPSARYAPLRLRLVALLNRLAASTGRFIPVAPLLMELLTFSELTKPPVSSKSHPPDFTIVLRLAKQDLRLPGVQDIIVESCMEALSEHLHQNAYSPAFPELAHIPMRELKKFCKTVNVTRFRKAARAVIEATERTSDWVIRKRDNVDFAPKDLDKVDAFLRDEKAEGKAPVSRLAKTLHEKAAQRVAAQQATDVKLTRKPSTGASDSEDDDEDGDMDDDEGEERAGHDDDDEEDEEDDFGDDDGSDSDLVIDGDEAYAEFKKRKSASSDHDAHHGDEDKLEDLQLSDSDSDEPQGKAKKAKKVKSKSRKT